jgi:acyl transferase domain-containing protein/acyl carrier protein
MKGTATAVQEAIALVGMACRFHGTTTVDQFWEHLAGGHELIDRLSEDEVRAAGEPEAWFASPNYVKACGIIDGIDMCDAAFFGLNPKEAEILDPQVRLFLECCWEALEDACCVPDAYPGRIGVFGGKGTNHYYLSHLRPNASVQRSVGNLALHVSNDRDYLSTRVSYTLNLNGPSLSVQTASSTSLVAVCLGSQSLLTFESDLVLAGGVYLQLHKTGYRHEEGGLTSPDGHCRTFDAKARGTIFTSGVGVVALKRLSDAIADRDNIRAVIRGFALNNDGSAKVGFTAPSVKGQAAVIEDAMAMANVNPERIGYVEAHGTATELGDPIEIAALTNAYRAHTTKRGYCAIGSVKTNLGHTHSAAGVAGLIKTALTLQHALIPPTLHFEAPNPEIDFANSPFFVNHRLREWPGNGHPRMAGVSAFGVGGTNAHVVLEEAPQRPAVVRSPRAQLLVLSAMDDRALDAATDRLATFLERRADVDIADVAYSLQVGRKRFGRRRSVVCRDRADAVAALVARDPERVFTATGGPRRQIVFMFPRSESDSTNVGTELYRDESIFRDEVDRCLAMVKDRWPVGLRAIVGPPAVEPTRQVAAEPVSLPALFVFEYALARLWMAWGVQAEAMIGDGVGEYVASCLSGALSLDQALTLACEHSRRIQENPAEAMTAETVIDRFIELSKEPDRVFLEVGPGQMLTMLLERHAASRGRTLLASLSRSSGNESARERMLSVLGQLWVSGANVDWDAVHRSGDAPARVPLPTYPFQRQRYWIDPPAQGAVGRAVRAAAGGTRDLAEQFYVASWRRTPPAITAADTNADQTWVIFQDEYGIGEELSHRLADAGRSVHSVVPGAAFAHIGPTRHVINSSEPADYRALIEAVDARRALHIVYAWSLAADAVRESDAAAETAREACFYGLLYLGQALGQRREGLRVQLEIVGTGTHEVTGAEGLAPESALALGPCRTLPHECANVTCRHVDVELPASPRQRSRLVDLLLAEFQAVLMDTVVAYRGGHRWAQAFEIVRLETTHDDRALRSRGVYVVTGGLGGIGLIVAEYLARTVEARLVLIARTPFPERSQWQEWIASHGSEDRVSQVIGRLLECESQGAEVLVFSADVTSEPQMRTVIDGVTRRWGSVHGVFHAAGVPGGGLMQLKTRRMAEAVLAPKVVGTRVLATVLADQPLDLFVMFSSLLAVVPVVGQADYAAANAFMDAFAYALRRKIAARVTSIKWDAWHGVGMFAATQDQRRVLLDQSPAARAMLSGPAPGWSSGSRSRRMAGLLPGEGIAALRRILATTADVAEIVVSSVDLTKRLARARVSTQTQLLESIEQRAAESKPIHPRPPLEVAYVAPRNEIEASVAEAWQAALGIESVGVRDGFLDLGGNSLLTMQIAARIRQAFQVTLPLEEFFKAPTIADLSEVIAQRLIARPAADRPATPHDALGAGARERRSYV